MSEAGKPTDQKQSGPHGHMGRLSWLRSSFGHKLTSANSGLSKTPLAWPCWRSDANTTDNSTSRVLDSRSLGAVCLKWPAGRSLGFASDDPAPACLCAARVHAASALTYY